MTVFQMRCFLEVANRLSFTEAAERMYISQSSLSRNISNIEDELGVKLFTRRNNAIYLTTAGRVLASGLEKICESYDALCVRVDKAEMGIVDELRIGVLADQTINESVADAIHRFKAEWADVNIVFSRHEFKELFMNIVEGKLDLAIGFKHAMDFDKSLGFAEISTENVSMAVPRSYETTSEVLKAEELAELLSKYQLYAISQESFPVYTNLPNRRAALIEGYKTQYINTVTDLPLYVSLGIGVTMVNDTNILSLDKNIKTIPLDKSVIPLDKDAPIIKVLCYNRHNLNMPTMRFLEIFSEIKAGQEQE